MSTHSHSMKMGKEGYEKPYKKIEYIFVGK